VTFSEIINDTKCRAVSVTAELLVYTLRILKPRMHVQTVGQAFVMKSASRNLGVTQSH